jgi:hypothetical protein
MSSNTAPLCRHIKVNGTQCGSPALRSKNFCFYHQQHRPMTVDCYYNPEEYATGEITLPLFEDAHSIQSVIRQVVQMVLQKRLERKTASLLLYALQIASSNLKRMELEKPQPEQVVIDVEKVSKSEIPIAAIDATPESHASPQPDQIALAVTPSTPTGKAKQEEEDKNKDQENDRGDENLPPGTIQACHRPDVRPWDRLPPCIVNKKTPRYNNRRWQSRGK